MNDLRHTAFSWSEFKYNHIYTYWSHHRYYRICKQDLPGRYYALLYSGSVFIGTEKHNWRNMYHISLSNTIQFKARSIIFVWFVLYVQYFSRQPTHPQIVIIAYGVGASKSLLYIIGCESIGWLCKAIVMIDEACLHDDVIKWKHFPRNWPFVRGIHRSPVNSPHKGQWRGALMFSLICVWINYWVNNRENGDLKRYRAHYDVIVMDHG